MNIEHIAIWTRNLDELKMFYCAYFNGVSNERYVSVHAGGRKFESHILSFGGDCRLELMREEGIPEGIAGQTLGLAHFSFGMPSREAVDTLAMRLESDGFRLVGRPRTTGDGFYEACILDPEGNRVEFAVAPAIDLF